MTMKRCFDLLASCLALLLLAPLMVLAALAIKLSDPGPVFYRADRAGRGGTPFSMFKFRTMRVVQVQKSAITAQNDQRIFALGNLLRMSKIDELPQLFNVIKGEMSIVGPRPEALSIVARFYQPAHLETLKVAPGLASPGSLYGTIHFKEMIGCEHPERDYAEKLLPIKLGLELVYIRKISLIYDLIVIWRTIHLILSMALGRKNFPDPPEYEEASCSFLFPITAEKDSP